MRKQLSAGVAVAFLTLIVGTTARADYSNLVINIQVSSNQVQLTWPYGVLQSAPEVSGPYDDMAGVSSPYNITPSGERQFYRTRADLQGLLGLAPQLLPADGSIPLYLFGSGFGSGTRLFLTSPGTGTSYEITSFTCMSGSQIVVSNLSVPCGIYTMVMMTTNGQPILPNNPDGMRIEVSCSPNLLQGALTEPPTAGSCQPPPVALASRPIYGVQLFSGEFCESAVDLWIAARGFNLVWERTYRSRTGPNTAQGNRWDFSYNIFITRTNGANAELFDGRARHDAFYQQGDGTFSRWESLCVGATNTSGNFLLISPDGAIREFAPLDASSQPGKILHSSDRNGNMLAVGYDLLGRPTNIVNTVGQSLQIAYNTNGFVESVTDFTGRHVGYAYYQDGDDGGSAGDLKSVTGPLTNITTYTYTKGSTNESLNHNLLSITDPNGWTYLRNSYGTNSTNCGKVVQQFWSNSVDVVCFTYIPKTPSLTNPSITMKSIVNDPVGNVKEYLFDSRNRCVSKRDYTGRAVPGQPVTETQNRPTGKLNPSDPDFFETRWEWNADSQVRRATYPNGAIIENTYESDLNTNALPLARGNLRTRRQLSTDQPALVEQFGYNTNSICVSFVTQRTNANGRVISYEYDIAGNRTNETNPLGFTRAWTYDAYGDVLTEKDRIGNVTLHFYNEFGYCTNTTDALLNAITSGYDAIGNLTNRTDANGRATSYTYDLLNRLTIRTDPRGGTTRSFYDAKGNLVRVIDQNTNSTFYGYDGLGRLRYRTNALGGVYKRLYDGNGNLILEADENGHTNRFNYDERDQLIRTTNALHYVTRRTHDAVGNIINETDANGHVTRYGYDGLSRRVAITNALGFVARFEYATADSPPCCSPTFGSSLVTKQTDANGKVTYFKYDVLDRLTKIIRKQFDTADVIDGDDAVTTHSYDPNDNVLSEIEPNGNLTVYSYDVLNHRVAETNFAGDITLTAYDPVGNVLTVTAPNGNVTTNTYDGNNRLVQVDDSVGRVAGHAYDGVGNRISRTDGNINTTQYAYDALNRLVRTTDPMLQSSTNVYDPVGNLIRVTDRENRVTICGYDGLNRRTSTTNALNGVTRYFYDGVGNLLGITDANGHNTTFLYDAANRLVKEFYPEAVPNTRTFAYDAVGNLTSRTNQNGQVTLYRYSDLYFPTNRIYATDPPDYFTYDLSGRLLTAAKTNWLGGTNWLVTFAYDGANRIINTTQGGRAIVYAYNISGRTRTLTYPGGTNITETTDARGRLFTVNDGGTTPIAAYTNDFGNRVLTRTYRNSVVAGYDYNPNNWLTTLTHSNSTGLVAGFAYGYDNEGNKLCASNFFDPLQSEAYSYDAIFRLTNHLVGNLTSCTVPAPGAQTQWQLDPVGNWLCKISNGVSEYRTNNAVNEITQRGGTLILSDDNGNEIDDGTFQYDWDQENRLVAVTRLADNQVVGQYAYDALGRRIVKVASPAETVTSTVYLHDGNRIVEEQSATGVTMATFTFGNYIDEVLTMNRGGQTYYYHQNALWSATALTDSAAVPTERYTFDAYGCAAISDGTGTPVTLNAWGTPHSALGNPFMFTGRQLDEEAGLYCYRARYYSPGLGRFISPDPIGNWADGMNLGNGFAYVGNSPINRLDPMGLGWWGKAKAAVGAVVGAVAEAAKAVAEAVAEAVESSAEPPVSTNETEMDRQVKKLFKLEGEKQMWNEISTMQTCQTYGTFGSVGDGTGTYKTKPADFLDPVGGALFALGIQEEIILRDIKRSDPELAKGLAIAAGR